MFVCVSICLHVCIVSRSCPRGGLGSLGGHRSARSRKGFLGDTKSTPAFCLCTSRSCTREREHCIIAIMGASHYHRYASTHRPKCLKLTETEKFGFHISGLAILLFTNMKRLRTTVQNAKLALQVGLSALFRAQRPVSFLQVRYAGDQIFSIILLRNLRNTFEWRQCPTLRFHQTGAPDFAAQRRSWKHPRAVICSAWDGQRVLDCSTCTGSEDGKHLTLGGPRCHTDAGGTTIRRVLQHCPVPCSWLQVASTHQLLSQHSQPQKPHHQGTAAPSVSRCLHVLSPSWSLTRFSPGNQQQVGRQGLNKHGKETAAFHFVFAVVLGVQRLL